MASRRTSLRCYQRLLMVAIVEFAVNHSSGSNIWRCTPSINILLSLTLAGRLHILLTDIRVLPLQLSTMALSIYVYKRIVSKKIIFHSISKMNAFRIDAGQASGSPTQCSSRNKLLTSWTLANSKNKWTQIADAKQSEQIPHIEVEQSKTIHFIENFPKQTK